MRRILAALDEPVCRYEPLVLTAYAQAKWEDWPGFAKRIMTGRHPSSGFKKDWLDRLCEDVIGVEVAIAYGAGELGVVMVATRDLEGALSWAPPELKGLCAEYRGRAGTLQSSRNMV